MGVSIVEFDVWDINFVIFHNSWQKIFFGGGGQWGVNCIDIFAAPIDRCNVEPIFRELAIQECHKELIEVVEVTGEGVRTPPPPPRFIWCIRASQPENEGVCVFIFFILLSTFPPQIEIFPYPPPFNNNTRVQENKNLQTLPFSSLTHNPLLKTTLIEVPAQLQANSEKIFSYMWCSVRQTISTLAA